ncbi:uncharacterized protein LOC114916837 [Cajanus cajan]|uniref:Retrotransposon gag domain-containing protein n=1 Tax=Cajanus cajan TaxID=3821 RepID=A0A151S4N2_CAJCA|nr:uncharacterized protein LOC114916837 [Cajanus cajan]KYP49795.1 hypothetical protein KK1_028480 [Cajanus cajan]
MFKCFKNTSKSKKPKSSHGNTLKGVTNLDFQVNPALLSLLSQDQFAGGNLEDPNAHISKFLEISETVKFQDVPEEAVKMRLFPLTLKDDAKEWYQTQPKKVFTSWEIMIERFIDHFFPHSLYFHGRNQIINFMQKEGEDLFDTWERYKCLLKKCPHGFDEFEQVHYFLIGLRSQTRMILDASAGGNMKSKTAKEAVNIIENMASNEYSFKYDKGPSSRRGTLELDTKSASQEQHKLVTNQSIPLTIQLRPMQKIGQ